MKLYDPTPTNLDKIPLQVYLTKSGQISAISFNLQLTINCVMNFKLYPFDRQVTHYI